MSAAPTGSVASSPRDVAAFTALADALAAQLDPFSEALCVRLLEAVPGLPKDQRLRDLLFVSVRANIDAAVRIFRGELDPAQVTATAAALEYARHLARLEVPSGALARAYRLGQQHALDWGIEEFARIVTDPRERLECVRHLAALNFSYVDQMSELVLAEHQAERDAWLAHRTTVKAEILDRLLADRPVDVVRAEQALSYRLRRHHLAGVIWVDHEDRSAELGGLEGLCARVAASAGGAGEPLVRSQDPTSAWWWLPVDAAPPSVDALRAAVARTGSGVRLALGGPGRGVEGFRESHLDALLAERVARIAGPRAPAVVSSTEQGVRAAALLAKDLEGARQLVRTTLRDLAADTRQASDLRTTVQVYLAENGSQSATAQRLHVHKNTVNYRLGKAAELCGGALRHNRIDVELALVACQWLGEAVLTR